MILLLADGLPLKLVRVEQRQLGAELGPHGEPAANQKQGEVHNHLACTLRRSK